MFLELLIVVAKISAWGISVFFNNWQVWTRGNSALFAYLQLLRLIFENKIIVFKVKGQFVDVFCLIALELSLNQLLSAYVFVWKFLLDLGVFVLEHSLTSCVSFSGFNSSFLSDSSGSHLELKFFCNYNGDWGRSLT